MYRVQEKDQNLTQNGKNYDQTISQLVVLFNPGPSVGVLFVQREDVAFGPVLGSEVGISRAEAVAQFGEVGGGLQLPDRQLFFVEVMWSW